MRASVCKVFFSYIFFPLRKRKYRGRKEGKEEGRILVYLKNCSVYFFFPYLRHLLSERNT